MKRFLPGIAAVLIVALTSTLSRGGWYYAASASVSYTYLIEEDYEGTGYESGSWTESGSPDEDYTGDPLEGAQSLRVSASAATVTTLCPSWTNTASTTTCFLLKPTTDASFVNIIQGLTAAGSSTWSFLYGSSSHFRITHGSTQSANGTLTYSTGTLYYIWIEYTKGTGADGVMRLYVSTTSTKPGSPDITISNGNGTNDHGRIRFGHNGSTTQTFITDHLRAVGDASSVTTWPE